MNQTDVIIRIILSLGVLSRWVILSGSASAVLHFHHFRKAQDIDLVAHPAVFLLLCVFKPRGWKMDLPKKKFYFKEWRLVNTELNIEMFMFWRSRTGYIPYQELANRTNTLRGIRCIAIQDVLRYKSWLRRPKDIMDVLRIEKLRHNLYLAAFLQERRTVRVTPYPAPLTGNWEFGFIDTG